MKKIFYSIIACITICINASAQIGYQVSLLNTATGEPRANVSVNATVKITDSQDGTIYSGTQRVTSNDFGVLSLTVGDENTFANVDWGKLPLFIEVQVDGATIGKSQILSVPVAEVSKTVKPGITREELAGTWQTTYEVSSNNGAFHGTIQLTFSFSIDGSYNMSYSNTVTYPGTTTSDSGSGSGVYDIEGRSIYLLKTNWSGEGGPDVSIIHILNGNLYVLGSRAYVLSR